MEANLLEMIRPESDNSTSLIYIVNRKSPTIIYIDENLLPIRVIERRNLNEANLVFHIDSICAIRGQHRVGVIEDRRSV